MSVQYKGSLPHGFYDTIPLKADTIETMKKDVIVGENVVYDNKKFYGRLLVLVAEKGCNT